MDGSVNRDGLLHFRVGAVERRAAEALSHYEGVRLSEGLRLALREAAARRGLWPPTIGGSQREDQNMKGVQIG
jgi:hypothetical protein